MQMKRILSITIKHHVDEDPDTSDLGQYTDSYDPHYFDREQGKMLKTLERDKNYKIPNKGREYRFFIPCAGGEEPTKGNRTNPLYVRYGKQDLDRMEGLCKGDWTYIGISAEARVQTGSDVVQLIHSGGLWGIESDSEEAYLTRVEEEELAGLQRELEAIGFTDAEVGAVEVERKGFL